MTDPAPKIGAVLETAIYVDDLARAGRFYEETLGLAPMLRDARMWAFDCGPGSVLLAFLRGATAETLHLPGGEIPPHEGMGRLHFALAIAAAGSRRLGGAAGRTGCFDRGADELAARRQEPLLSRSRPQSGGVGDAWSLGELLSGMARDAPISGD